MRCYTAHHIAIIPLKGSSVAEQLLMRRCRFCWIAATSAAQGYLKLLRLHSEHRVTYVHQGLVWQYLADQMHDEVDIE